MVLDGKDEDLHSEDDSLEWEESVSISFNVCIIFVNYRTLRMKRTLKLYQIVRRKMLIMKVLMKILMKRMQKRTLMIKVLMRRKTLIISLLMRRRRRQRTTLMRSGRILMMKIMGEIHGKMLIIQIHQMRR